MLSKNEMALMNTPIWRGTCCVGYQRECLSPVVAELVLEAVHPANLGALPPSPDVLAWKAVQIGLISCMSEAFETVRKGQFN